MRMPKYRIRCWIPVEAEDDQLYEGLEEATKDLQHLEFLQPENIYKIERVNDHGTEEGGLEGLAEES